jgi:hypothetical protein
MIAVSNHLSRLSKTSAGVKKQGGFGLNFLVSQWLAQRTAQPLVMATFPSSWRGEWGIITDLGQG